MENTTSADTLAVRFSGVEKSFGAVRAVAGIDLALHRGETVALLGRNGAGKSTTLSLLLGLDIPDRGEVRLFGRTPEQSVRAGRVGAMLQEGSPIPKVTVRELVAFVGSTYPDPLPVAEALALAGLTEQANRRIDKLSGGQVQRARFAVALAGRPELVVLDEPTAALDVEARRAFWASMRDYAGRGNTVLFSTHYLEEADANADRIVVMDHGRIVADGSGEQLKRAGGDTLVSIATAPGGLDRDAFTALPGVTSVELREGRARLWSADADATVVALAARGAIRALEVAPATLEDAFLALTSGPASDAPGPTGTTTSAPAPLTAGTAGTTGISAEMETVR